MFKQNTMRRHFEYNQNLRSFNTLKVFGFFLKKKTKKKKILVKRHNLEFSFLPLDVSVTQVFITVLLTADDKVYIC